MLAQLLVKGRKGWIFTTEGDTPISGFSKSKRAFGAWVLADLRKVDPKAKLERRTTHDLRRSARSLMSRAGCLPDHAERALGQRRWRGAWRL
jgi:integrase